MLPTLVLCAAAALNFKATLVDSDLTIGRVVIPTLARSWDTRREFREARETLFAEGLYPGVDYVILARTESTVTVKPEYPLVAKLEREWPVTVDTNLAPRWMDPTVYNLLTAAFAIGLAVSGVLASVVLSSVLTLSVVKSTSMEPTIQPGDVLLVEKLTPRLGMVSRTDDLIFFEPPDALQSIVREREAAVEAERAALRAAGGDAGRPTFSLPQPSSRLFVKRIVGQPGDEVSVDANGIVRVQGKVVSDPTRSLSGPAASLLRPIKPGQLGKDEYFVLGDNAASSVDSRCWGALPADRIAGRPLLRVAPMSRVGAVK